MKVSNLINYVCVCLCVSVHLCARTPLHLQLQIGFKPVSLLTISPAGSQHTHRAHTHAHTHAYTHTRTHAHTHLAMPCSSLATFVLAHKRLSSLSQSGPTHVAYTQCTHTRTDAHTDTYTQYTVRFGSFLMRRLPTRFRFGSP